MSIRGGITMRRLAWVAAVLCLLSSCDRSADPGSSVQPIGPAVGVDDFLHRHWQRPLAPQGQAPGHFSFLEASLSPAACGTCHPRQFADWKTALHSRAMGPGLYGQLENMGPQAREEHAACLECHAPLAEQGQQLVAALAAAPYPALARGDGASHADGLTCAGCHLRDHRRFGPPRQDGSLPSSGLPHDGWQAERAFADSRFCAACHQFGADGPALNGKPLENTYEEWRASRHARENRQCQDCHMPQRRHLWRGIHDPEMARSGLDIAPSLPALAGGRIAFELTITNRNVGHAFPTYVTPRVVVEIAQENRRGQAIAGTANRYLIARDVGLDLTTEHSDTRLMPDEVRHYAYDRPRHVEAVALVIHITVEPDAFYARFYRATLKDPEFRQGRQALREALGRAKRSGYEMYRWRQELPPS